MVIEKLCPVCGYEMEEGPWNFNICPSCGTEFGLHDFNSTIRDLREGWWKNGAPEWHSVVIPRPDGWDGRKQLFDGVLSARYGMLGVVVPGDSNPVYLSSQIPGRFGRPRRLRKKPMTASLASGVWQGTASMPVAQRA
jgi:hypothetical protein